MNKAEIIEAGLDVILKCAALKDGDGKEIGELFLNTPYEVQVYLIQQIYVKNLVVQKGMVFKEHYNDLKFVDGSNVSKALIEMRDELYNEEHISGYVGESFVDEIIQSLQKNKDLNDRVVKDFPLIDMSQCYEIIQKNKEKNGFKYGMVLSDLEIVKNSDKWFLKDMSVLLKDDDLKEEVQEVFANVISEEQILNSLVKTEVSEDEHIRYVNYKVNGMAYINLFELFERRMPISSTPEMVSMINDLDRDFPLLSGKTVSKTARVGQSFYTRSMWKLHAERTVEAVINEVFKDDQYVMSDVVKAVTAFSKPQHKDLNMDAMDIIIKLRVVKDDGFLDEKLLSKVILNVLLNPRLNVASDNDTQKREVLVNDYLCYRDLQTASEGNQLKERDIVKESAQVKMRKF